MRFTDESFIYRIMGVDNGSTNLGIAVLDLDLRSGTYSVVHTRMVDAPRLLRRRRMASDMFGERWNRQNIIQDEFEFEINQAEPNDVAVETPFFMPGRVTSYEVLVEMMVRLRQSTERLLGKDFYGITPGQAKRAVQTKDFTMKKAVIKDCVLRLEHVRWNVDVDKDNLTEHEYDAVAVAIAHGNAVMKDTGFVR